MGDTSKRKVTKLFDKRSKHQLELKHKSSVGSKTSSQRRRGLLLAQARRQAVEQEVQADLVLAEKKQELELAQLKE